LELRWYWRVLRRQWRIIWLSLLVVAVLAAAYTAFTFSGGRYKGQTTVELSQTPPTYRSTSVNIDPEAAAQANASAARDSAKQFTQGIGFFQSISGWLKSTYGTNLDWKVIRAGLGANVSGQRYLEMEYASSSDTTANKVLMSAIAVLKRDFLPHYNATVLNTGSQGSVFEPPIQLYVFDQPSAPATSLSSTVISWFVKALLGLVLGVALAFLWEYLDESIHDEQDVHNWMSTPTLGVIPGGKARTT
jgi:hypothetical protein